MSRIHIFFVVVGIVTSGPFFLFSKENRLSPIMNLEEAIGVRVSKHDLSQKISDTLAHDQLLAKVDRKTSLVIPIGPQYIKVIDTKVSSINIDSVNLTAVLNHQPKKVPAVFLLDSGCLMLEIPQKGKKKVNKEDDVPPYVATPIGSHLISEGFAVGFASKDALSNESKIWDDEWVDLIRKFSKLGNVDRENVFLVSTFENAELAIRLAGQFYFAGVVIEAPRQVIFRERHVTKSDMNRQRFQESLGVLTKRLTSETSNDSDVIRQRYIENVEKLKSPLLIIASQNAPSYQAMKNTLLKTLSESSVTFQVGMSQFLLKLKVV